MTLRLLRLDQMLGLILTLSWLLVLSLWAGEPGTPHEPYWPQWRGPLGTGVAPSADPPVEWSEAKNIQWKRTLPGLGHSTPIIWGDRIFLTTAVPYGESLEPIHDNAPGSHSNLSVTRRHHFAVLAIRRSDGEILWQRTVHSELPHEGGHFTGSLASASPVTDGERLLVFFGSRGIYCLDLDGKLQWKKNLGSMRTKHGHGEGSSPVLHDETLVINWDHEGQSFVMALDKRTGRQRWKIARDEVTSWASPTSVVQDGTPQVIIAGTDRVRGYDLGSGSVVWECGGLSDNIVASPVAGKGMVFVGSSYDRRVLLAIDLAGAKGDITGTKHVAWSSSRRTPYVPSPLLYGESLYFLAHYQGVLSRVAANTGEGRPGPLRLEGIDNVYASPVAGANRVYVTDRKGTTIVISHADRPRVLARNRLQDGFNASAALVGRDLYLRGEKNLYSIRETASRPGK